MQLSRRVDAALQRAHKRVEVVCTNRVLNFNLIMIQRVIFRVTVTRGTKTLVEPDTCQFLLMAGRPNPFACGLRWAIRVNNAVLNKGCVF